MTAVRPSIDEQLALLTSGTVDVLPEGALRAKLEHSAKTGKPLRVKQGFDPTAPDIHLGHAVGLRKLRQFQELGHQVVLIVGDFTGCIGDPSGVSKTRPMLTREQLEANARTYLDQFGRVVDVERAEIRWNGEWFGPMTFADVIRLSAKITVARILERDDFDERLKGGLPVGLHELFYPLAQGYDSVAIEADVELGATEQKFNLLVGRALQTEYGQAPQVVMTLPILPGVDGVRRMSKSLGNYIGLTESPREMYGKVMSIPDSAIAIYLELATALPRADVARAAREIAERAVNPVEWKRRLAEHIVALYHSAEAATSAAEEFQRQFARREIPQDAPTVRLRHEAAEISMRDLLVACGAAPSNAQASRLIRDGAVSIEGDRVIEPSAVQVLAAEFHLRVGRKYWRVIPELS